MQRRLLHICLSLAILLPAHLVPALLPPAFLVRSRSRSLAPVPPEIASSHFTVTIDGHSTPVLHAALNLYFLNFEARGKHTTVSVTADTDSFWSTGVEVQPWRLGIRPQRNGRTITFSLDGPAQISISRPGDFLTDAEMLYIFANPPESHPPTFPSPGLQYFGPGVHRENIDAHSGNSIYLAPGAVVFGALNLWGVDHVRVSGRGVLVYDGPQNPADDDGWMHKPNWHCITMDNAHDISVEGITCVVRSRTWQIQMKDSRRIAFDNVKVIGANAGNANADGMDWLGGGDTTVRNSFFRAADDIFAMQTSWEGYGPVAFAVQGSPVTNISVENAVLSTSVSNIVRAGWPGKNFEGGNFTLSNSDVLHMGLGGCGVPFALMELWADPHGRGRSSGFHFNDIRLEDWYSLTDLEQPTPGIQDATFTDIAALELPARVPSVLSGDVTDVSFDNIVSAGTLATTEASLPLTRTEGAPPPTISETGPRAHIVSSTGLIRPRDKVHFEAITDGDSSTGLHDDPRSLHYDWTFGDGARAHGPKVTHRFPDTAGTLRDGTGRFRVLLHISAPGNRHTWLYQPVVVSDALLPAQPTLPGQTPGITFRYTEHNPDIPIAAPAPTNSQIGTQPTFSLTSLHRAEDYSLFLDGTVHAPTDGAYTFLVFANDAAEVTLDGKFLASAPKPFAQVCGLAGNATHALPVYVALAAGPHHLQITETHGRGRDHFQVLWQAPGMPLQPIPASALSHTESAKPEPVRAREDDRDHAQTTRPRTDLQLFANSSREQSASPEVRSFYAARGDRSASASKTKGALQSAPCPLSVAGPP